jgi:hypothetical protein
LYGKKRYKARQPNTPLNQGSSTFPKPGNEAFEWVARLEGAPRTSGGGSRDRTHEKEDASGFGNTGLPIQIELLGSLLYDFKKCRMKRVQKLCFTEKGTFHGYE